MEASLNNVLRRQCFTNVHAVELIGEVLLFEPGSCRTDGGGIRTLSVPFTGRSPKAKRIVRDRVTARSIDWSENTSMSSEEFDMMFEDFIEYAEGLPRIYVQHVEAVRDPKRRFPVSIYTELASHSLFSRNMFIPDCHEEPDGWKVLNLPSMLKGPSVMISFKRKTILISGTRYAGEIKKSVFTVLNFMFPKVGELPMHCSVNVDKDGKNPAIFFGLSGTGKTTLSSDENRILVGDDEHVWTDDGISNFENGCYAKTLRLSEEAEPLIYRASNQHGSLLENVVVDREGKINYDDTLYSENGRVSYPISFIENACEKGYVDEQPKNVVMLTCDAYGVLPPVMKLSPKEAYDAFLLGYTAKVAGTEKDVTEPVATFSPCFGSPFMPLPFEKYAKLLKKRLRESGAVCWLVNTGWTGGSYGDGERMPIAITRRIIDMIHSGELAECETEAHEYTGFRIPMHNDLPESLMKPELNWKSKDEYILMAKQLQDLFKQQGV